MSGRRDSSALPEAFNVRWHSVADMSTPRADIMSSPDPLNDADSTAPPPSSSRRVTRSQRSERFMSLGSRSVSPRKQTFSLQVGDQKSPQKLFVTVEAEDEVPASGTRRKLFQPSPSPAKTRTKTIATTTTVPLRDSIEEESTDALTTDPLATPKRRGRPRKSNGTPMPKTGTKRKAGTPIKRTPGRPRAAKANDTDDMQSEASVQSTPKSSRRGRPPKAQPVQPSSDIEVGSVTSTVGARGRRRRRQALVPDEFMEMADEAAENASIQESAAPSENEMDLIMAPPSEGAPSERNVDEIVVNPTPEPERELEPEPESDLWMATLSDQATPRAANRAAPVDPRPKDGRGSPELGSNDLELSQPGDYGYLPPAASDISSADEPLAESVPRNDTIAQGEDFSMIFADSIPSLQASLHASAPPVADEEFGEETNFIINNTLESLRQETERDEEVEVQEEAEIQVQETVEPDEPDELAQPENADPVSITEFTERRSTLSPSRRLSRLSRSPRKQDSSPLRRQVLRMNARQAEAAVDEDDDREPTPRASFGRRVSGRFDTADDSNLYEDSFSEIPQDVLEAATPRRPDAMPPMDDMDDMDNGLDLVLMQEEEAGEEQEEEQPLRDPAEDGAGVPSQDQADEAPEEQGPPAAASASNVSVSARSDGGRLPTPDDTPSFNEEEVDDQEKSTQASHVSQASSGLASPERSSSHVGTAAEAVPRISEPPQQATASLARPSLPFETTPIEQMSSPAQDPQSLAPEPVLEKLARPALSPIMRAGRVLQSVTSDPPSPEGRERQLGSPFRSSASKESRHGSKERQGSRPISMSPQHPLRVSQGPPMRLNRSSEDPFGASTRSIGQTGFMQALNRSMNAPPTAERPASRGSAASSMRVTPPGDEMSWIVDEGPISPNLRGDNSLKDASRSSTRRVRRGSLSHGQIDGASDELADEPVEEDPIEEELVEEPVEEPAEEPAERDDETDIWEFEAQRETPRSTRQKPFGKRAAAPVYRRGTIPSPWAKKSTRAPVEAASVPERSEQPQKTHQPSNMAAEAEEVDEETMLSQRPGPLEPSEAVPESATKADRFNLSSFFSSPAAIPGMLAGKLFASKTKPAQEPSQTETAQAAPFMPTSSMFPQVPQKQFNPQPSPRKNLFSSARPSQPEKELDLPGSSSPATPDKLQMPTVAQKKNFTPRPRQTSQTFFQPSSARSAAQTPPRMQLSHQDIERWQHETSTASDESPELARRLLRPLPPKHASPTKSSLRSPMKPHTPGRVVEFTSSVLSPVDQVRARQLRMGITDSTFEAPVPVLQAPVIAAVQEMDDKENHDISDISMSDAPPLTKPAQAEALSQVSWSREHWLLLDELLQLRRQGPFNLDYERRAEKYLGKTVKSQGEAMKLQRWHLDCVDAFKAEVGGWDEGVLAKRLFALILGEQRRAAGMPRRPATRMFH